MQMCARDMLKLSRASCDPTPRPTHIYRMADDGFTLRDDMVIVEARVDANYYLPRSDDYDGLLRDVLAIGRCPLHEQCVRKDGSNPSWRKMGPWTFMDGGKDEGEAKLKMLGQLKYHLCQSGLHKLSDQVADQYIRNNAWSIDWQRYNDTYEMRESYRKRLETDEFKKLEKEWKDNGSGSNKKRKGASNGETDGRKCTDDRESLSSSVDRHERDEGGSSVNRLCSILLAQQASTASASTPNALDITHPMQMFSAPPAPPTHITGPVMVDLSRLVQARDHLRRGEEALQSSMCTIVECAKRVRSEAFALTDAREKLDAFIRDAQR